MHSSENAEPVLKRALGHFHLITPGVGAGISVPTDDAAARFSGPAAALRFVTAGLGCLFAGPSCRLGIAMCLSMMMFVPMDTRLRLAAWTAIGLAIYYLYSVKHAAPSRHAFAGQ